MKTEYSPLRFIYFRQASKGANCKRARPDLRQSFCIFTPSTSYVMRASKLFTFFAVLISGILLLILWDSFSQPGVGDLAGDFREVAQYRNENNTGPVIRLYAVSVNDTLWDEMEQYGQYMPHTKYGTTQVYFFLNNTPAPTKLQPGTQAFEDALKPYCLAVYEKNSMGQVSFRKYPFRSL
jgi:hypothetical protein